MNAILTALAIFLLWRWVRLQKRVRILERQVTHMRRDQVQFVDDYQKHKAGTDKTDKDLSKMWSKMKTLLP